MAGPGPREQVHHDRWRAIRARGRRAYVLKHGVLLWGGPMFLAMGLLMPWIRGDAARLAPTALLLSAIIFLLGGLAFGLLTWHFAERKFLRNEPREQAQ